MTTQTTAATLEEELDNQDGQSLKEWVQSLSGGGTFKISIARSEPLKVQGVKTNGHLETVSDLFIDEEYLKSNWGGGTFRLAIRKPNAKGKWTIFKHHSVIIAGHPLLSPLRSPDDMRGGEEEAGSRASEFMERQIERADRRADRAEASKSNGHGDRDSDFINSITRPFITQIEILSGQLDDMREKLSVALNREPPKDEFKDRLLETMVDQDSARLKGVRDQHESELRTVRERFEGVIDRMRDHHTAELERLRNNQKEDMRDVKRTHERAVDLMDRSYQVQVESGKGALEARIEVLKGQSKMLERQFDSATRKVETLESKKNKTMVETAGELAKTVSSLKTLGMIKSDEGEGGGGKWYERLAGAVVESPGFSALIGKFAGLDDSDSTEPVAQDPAQATQQMMGDGKPPLNVPFKAPDGQIYVRTGEDEYRRIDPEAVKRAKARAKRDGASQPEEPAAGSPPTDEELLLAIKFLEGAYGAKTDPGAVARSSRSMIPPSIFAYIQHVGVDDFLNRVAQLSPGSPLTDQVGRKFARDVAKVLLEEAP